MAKSNYVCDMNREELYTQWEQEYDAASWDDIISITQQAIDLNVPDATVESIANYVFEENKISWLQYKVLKNHLYYHSRKKNMKFKYGK
jgi:hypothetical protein